MRTRKRFLHILSLALLLAMLCSQTFAFAATMPADNNGRRTAVGRTSDAEGRVRIIVVTDYTPSASDAEGVSSSAKRAAAKSASKVGLMLMESEEPYEIISEYTHIFTGYAVEADAEDLSYIQSLPGVKEAFIEREWQLFDMEEEEGEYGGDTSEKEGGENGSGSNVEDVATAEALTSSGAKDTGADGNKYEESLNGSNTAYELSSNGSGYETFANANENLTLIGSAVDANNTEYRGEGMAIAVIDTGLYFSSSNQPHVAFRGTINNSKYSSQDIAGFKGHLHATWTEDPVPSFWTDKIPFTYDYALESTSVSGGDEHGTHVAGIIGANSGKIRGVAPDAQLLIMKVTGSNGGIGDIAVMNALEDAVVFGVDAINLSIGTPAGFDSSSITKYNTIYNNISNAGIAIYCSAGNNGSVSMYNYNLRSYMEKKNGTNYVEDSYAGPYATYYANYTDQSDYHPYIENPDTAMVAEPSTYSAPLSVASSSVDSSAANTRMSDFSAWGPSPGLKIKPEIVAPGGSVYSSINSDAYGTMSGTSMASPHLAGASAVIKQYIESKHSDIVSTGVEISSLADKILMSSAVPLKDGGGNYYSPRRQGAGLLQLTNALRAGAYLSVALAEGERPKAELGESNNGVFSFNFSATSLAKEGGVAENYVLSAVAMVERKDDDNIAETSRELVIGSEGDGKSDIVISFSSENNKVLLNPGDSAKVSVNIGLTSNQNHGKKLIDPTFPYGAFIEGYIFLTPTINTNLPVLSLPFMGFYGDWDELSRIDGAARSERSLFDATVYDSTPKISMLEGAIGYFDKESNKGAILGQREYTNDARIDVNRMAIKGGESGKEVVMSFALLRNADDLRMEIKNLSTGGTVYSNQKYNAGKSYGYRYLASNEKYVVDVDFLETDPWMPFVYSRSGQAIITQPLPDGDYSYILKAKKGEHEESLSYTIRVDSKAPEYVSASLSGDTFTINLRDEHYIQAVYLGTAASVASVPNKDWIIPEQNAAGESVSVSFDLNKEPYKSLKESKSGRLIVVDYAGNVLIKEGIFASHTVTFDANGGSEISSQIIEFGEMIDVTKIVYEKEGYSFSGFTNKGEYFEISSKIVENLTLVAEWTPVATDTTYSVQIGDHDHGSIVLSSSSGKYGDTIVVTATPDEGYVVYYVNLDGATLTAEEDGKYSFIIRGSHTVSAVFGDKLYSPAVVQPAHGAIALSPTSGAPGATVNVYAAYTEPGFKLTKIYVNGAEIDGDSFTLGESDTVTAEFTEIYPGRELIQTGQCGASLYFYLYKNPYEIYIFGDGTMYTKNQWTELDIDSIYIERATIDAKNADISSEAFQGYAALKTAVISGVNDIKDSAFSGNSELAYVSIEEGCTGIMNFAFSACTSLRYVGIPKSMESIGLNAFNGCDALIEKYYGGSPEEWAALDNNISGKGSTPDGNAPVRNAAFVDKKEPEAVTAEIEDEENNAIYFIAFYKGGKLVKAVNSTNGIYSSQMASGITFDTRKTFKINYKNYAPMQEAVAVTL